MLCALDTLAPVVKFNFLGGGDGLCTVPAGVEGGLGTRAGFADALGASALEPAESVALCPCIELAF